MSLSPVEQSTANPQGYANVPSSESCLTNPPTSDQATYSSSSIFNISSTSAQMTLSCAFMSYQALYGEIEFDNIKNEDDLAEIRKKLTNIIANLIDSSSRDRFLKAVDPDYETANAPPAEKSTKKYKTLLPSKLNYFDTDDKIILSDKGIRELTELLAGLPLNTENEVFQANEYNTGPKAATISTRRIAGVAALWKFLGADSNYAISSTDAAYFVEDDITDTSSDIINSIFYLGYKALFGYYIVANLQRWARRSRAKDIVIQYRVTMTKAVIGCTTDEDSCQPTTDSPFLSLHSDDSLLSHEDNKGLILPMDLKKTPDSINSEAVTTHEIESGEEQSRKVTPYPIVVYGGSEKSQEKALREVNIRCNVLLLKDHISAQASKSRKIATIGASLLIATGLVIINILAGGIPLGISLIIAGVIGITSFLARYYSKRLQNRRKIFAKQYRNQINTAFSEPLIAELSIFGLQPTDKNLTLSASATGIRRKVQDDVESFLVTHQYDYNPDTKVLTSLNGCNITFKSPEDFHDRLKRHIEKNTPEEYLGCNEYFVIECILQIAEKTGEDKRVIDAEREELFFIPTAEFFARQEAGGIKRFHQHIQINDATAMANLSKETKEEKPKLTLDHCDVVIDSNQRKQVLAMIYKDFPTFGSLWEKSDNDNAMNEEEVKNRLKKSWWFALFKLKRHHVIPFTLSEAANSRYLNAYFVETRRNYERKLARRNTPQDANFHKSGKTLFYDLIGKNNQNLFFDLTNSNKNKEDYEEKKELYEKNRSEYKVQMSGVLQSSFWSGFRSSLISCIPMMGIPITEAAPASSGKAGRTIAKIFGYGTLSAATSYGFVHLGIGHARETKREARMKENLKITQKSPQTVKQQPNLANLPSNNSL